MSGPDPLLPPGPPRDADGRQREALRLSARARRNWAILGAICAWVVVIYLVAVLRMGGA